MLSITKEGTRLPMSARFGPGAGFPRPELVSSLLRFLRKEHEENEELAKKESGLMHKLLHLNISPANPPDPEMMEDLLAKEMDSLTFEEKEKAAFDVHGLSSLMGSSTTTDLAEGPSLVEQTKLIELDAELKKLKVDTTNPLVQSDDFRLLFLRCDDLDVKVAAQRINVNLKMRREIFGHACVHREIQYTDLCPEDIRVLESGVFRVSPERDSAGRFVVIHRPTLRPSGVSKESCLRAAFYTLGKLAREPHVQRHGMVVVSLFTCLPGPHRRPRDKKQVLQHLKFMRSAKASLPKKVAAAHICVDTSNDANTGDERQRRRFIAAAQLMLPVDVRKRVRTHVGLKSTVEFQLGAYGINLDHADWPQPILCGEDDQDDQGEEEIVFTKDSSENKDQDMDNSEGTASTATDSDSASVSTAGASSLASGIVPTEHDVLFGRGKATRRQGGNKYAMQLVNQYRVEYEAAKKFEKTAIAERIVQMIANAGGRFLKYEKDHWVEVDSQTARNKISHLYRNTRNKVTALAK